jgi:DNA-directed RNA polymerase specialized sigma24 family protein
MAAQRPQDFTPELVERVGRLAAVLTSIAVRKTGAPAEAEELAQQALASSFDPDKDPWDPDRGIPLEEHALRVLGNLLRVRRKRNKLARDPRTLAAIAEVMTPWSRTPEEELAEAQHQAWAARVLDAACARLDPLARRVVQAAREGVDGPTAQARALGERVEDVRAAHKRIKYAVHALLAEHENSMNTKDRCHERQT